MVCQGIFKQLKGRKDELDIFALISLPEFNWIKSLEIINKFNFWSEYNNFVSLLKKTRKVVELGLNEKQLSSLKKKIKKD